MLRVTHPESDTAIFEYLDQNTNLGRLDYFTIKTLQSINVWVTSLGFWYNFGGKQDECLETDKFGQTAYSLFRR